MTPSVRITTSLLATAALCLVPVAIWAERADNNVWLNRLAIPYLVPEPDRHTSLFSTGTFLPPVITKNTTLRADQSPIIMPGLTTVVAGVTLTLEPGTTLAAQEFAALKIEGRLIARGTVQEPIALTSNEQHPDNKVWGGIIFSNQGQGELQHVTIYDGSPAVSCLKGSHLQAQRVRFERGSLGLYTESPTCALTDSTIIGSRLGVIAVALEPTLTNITFKVQREAIQRLDQP